MLRLHLIHDPSFVANPISTPPLIAFMLGARTVSTPMLVITSLSDWMTSIISGCLRISTTTTFDILGKNELIRVWWCPILWLPIGILCGAKCGCEYTFNILLVNWMDGWICQLCGPNWPFNSMLLTLLWITWIPSFWFCDRSINGHATFCNSTCLAIPVMMWKGTKRQSIVACLSSSQNAQPFESNPVTSESTYSWSYVLVV